LETTMSGPRPCLALTADMAPSTSNVVASGTPVRVGNCPALQYAQAR
jgi:hypothetical protein